MDKYVLDKKTGRIAPKRTTVGGVLLSALKYMVAGVAVAVLFYLVFALAFDTEREELLIREGRLLEEEIGSLERKADLLEGAVGELRLRDRKIYNDLFEADPPNYIVESADTLLRAPDELGTLTEEDLIWDAWAVASRAETMASLVSRALAQVDTMLTAGGRTPTALPSIVPIRNFSPMQTGASVGKKIHPFYKTVREHTGVDLVANAGTEVLSSADGKVVSVVRSKKGMGNTVVIDHGGGYRTSYSHLEDIRVAAGQGVRQGAVIGTVGQTGSCFAPCLHYEVRRGSQVQDPVNYFFAQTDPVTYHEMTIVALTTGQSLD